MNTTLICALFGLPLMMPPQAPDAAQEEKQTATSSAAEDRFDALEAEAQEAVDNWRAELQAKYKEAEENGTDPPMMSMTPPLEPFVKRCQAAAAEYAGTEDAVQFLVWLTGEAMWVDEEAGKAAFVTLFDHHAKSEGIEDIVSVFPYLAQIFDAKTAKAYIAKIEAENPFPHIKGWAAFARLGPAFEGATPDSAEFKAAKKEMMAILENVKDRELKSQVGFKIRLVEQFQIGMVAPDIDGIDLDGVPFKLSDYKGKVLFVDFWGDW